MSYVIYIYFNARYQSHFLTMKGSQGRRPSWFWKQHLDHVLLLLQLTKACISWRLGTSSQKIRYLNCWIVTELLSSPYTIFLVSSIYTQWRRKMAILLQEKNIFHSRNVSSACLHVTFTWAVRTCTWLSRE